MAKVKCKVCSNEVGGICSIKKCKIRLNKSRTCDAFVFDSGKVKIKEKPKSTRVYHNNDIRFNLHGTEKIKNKTDVKHPLTGDLSRFSTSATSNKSV